MIVSFGLRKKPALGFELAASFDQIQRSQAAQIGGPCTGCRAVFGLGGDLGVRRRARVSVDDRLQDPAQGRIDLVKNRLAKEVPIGRGRRLVGRLDPLTDVLPLPFMPRNTICFLSAASGIGCFVI